MVEARIEAFRSQNELMSAQYSAAKASVGANEAVTGISSEMGEMTMAMQRVQEKVLHLHAHADAIEQAGLRGKTHGKARISAQSANYIVNQGGERADDIAALMVEAHQQVLQQFGMNLALNVNLLGGSGRLVVRRHHLGRPRASSMPLSSAAPQVAFREGSGNNRMRGNGYG